MTQEHLETSPEALGYAAFIAGKPSTDNPFELGSADSARWTKGWLRGEDASREQPSFGVRLWRFKIRGDHLVLFAIAALFARVFLWDRIVRLSDQPGHLSIFILGLLVMVGIVTYAGPTRRP